VVVAVAETGQPRVLSAQVDQAVVVQVH